MGLLSGGDECYVCGKDVDAEECIEIDDKKFCCGECKDRYEDKQKEDEKQEVCQFC